MTQSFLKGIMLHDSIVVNHLLAISKLTKEVYVQENGLSLARSLSDLTSTFSYF